MLCETCENCQNYKIENGKHKITCKEEGGAFSVHETNAERFQCPDYKEHIPEAIPKDNVMIVISCGRDFLVYDERIYSEEDLNIACSGFDGFVKFGQLWFKKSDIVAYSYLGD